MAEKTKLENKRMVFYTNILFLIEDMQKLKNNNDDLYLIKYKEILALVSRMSNNSLSAIGRVNFDKEIDLINKVFIYGLILNIKPLLNFIFKDIIIVAQKYKLTKIMTNEPYPDIKDISKIKIWILRFIFINYFSCRQSNTTLIEEMLIFKLDLSKQSYDEDFLEQVKIGLFTYSLFLFQNDITEGLYKSTKTEREKIILFIFELGPKKNVTNKNFFYLLNEIIFEYVVSFFKKEKINNIYHITSIQNLNNIFDSNEVWFKKTEYLNDELEQKAFFQLLEENGLSKININEISKKDLNNDYFSFSTTYDYPKKELLKKYSGEVILEFNFDSSVSLFFGIKLGKHLSPIVGEVIYDKKEIMIIWNQIMDFLNKLKQFTNIKTYIKKAANICKMFYKIEKFKDEKEIRLVMRNEKFDNLKEDKTHYKLKGQLLTIFDNIYIDENQHLKLKSKLNQIEEKSYKITENYIYKDHEKEDRPFYDKLKKLT